MAHTAPKAVLAVTVAVAVACVRTSNRILARFKLFSLKRQASLLNIPGPGTADHDNVSILKHCQKELNKISDYDLTSDKLFQLMPRCFSPRGTSGGSRRREFDTCKVTSQRLEQDYSRLSGV